MRKLFEDYLHEISKEKLIELYIVKNLNGAECAKILNISTTTFSRLLKFYEIKKSKDAHILNIKKSKLEHFGDENYNNRQKSKETCKEKYGVSNVFQNKEIKEKSKATKLNKYGNENFVNQEKAKETLIKNYGSIENAYKKRAIKYKQTCLDRYGIENIALDDKIKEKIANTKKTRWKNLTEEEKKEISRKISQATAGRLVWNKGKKLGLIDEDLKKAILAKQYETKKKNNSFNSSRPEEVYRQYLIEKYGSNNVESQYNKDPRYPFECDFYIKSLDLFIELNLHWSHGGHPFTNSKADLKKLEIWKERAKTSEFYKNAIETWTVRDVKKIKTARENNLNYKIYYSEDEMYNG